MTKYLQGKRTEKFNSPEAHCCWLCACADTRKYKPKRRPHVPVVCYLKRKTLTLSFICSRVSRRWKLIGKKKSFISKLRLDVAQREQFDQMLKRRLYLQPLSIEMFPLDGTWSALSPVFWVHFDPTKRPAVKYPKTDNTSQVLSTCSTYIGKLLTFKFK